MLQPDMEISATDSSAMRVRIDMEPPDFEMYLLLFCRESVNSRPAVQALAFSGKLYPESPLAG